MEDNSIPDANGAWAEFEVDSKWNFFSHFRILQTGPNAYRETSPGYYQNNYAQLNVSPWYIYGCVLGATIH